MQNVTKRKTLWIMSPSKRSLSPPSSVEIKPGYPASMKLLSLPTIMSKCCFFTFFYNRNVFKEILNKSNKCRDVQHGVTLVMWNQGKVTSWHNRWPPNRRGHIWLVYSVNRDWFSYSWVDMIYIDMRIWFATFWSAYTHSFKGLSTEQGDEKSNNCVCGQVFHRKYKRIL